MLSAPPQSTVAPGAPRQRWGVLVLIGGLLGASAVVLIALASLLQLSETIQSFDVMFTSGDPEELRRTILYRRIIVVLAVLLGVATVALDTVTSALAVGRLRRGEPRRAVPVVVLITVALTTVLPLALGALIWLLDLAGIAHLPLLLGVVLLVVGGPIAMMLRFAQLVMGIIALARP